MSSMEFWGVEVKAGETLKVHPGDDYLLHLSQAALGESKKDKGTDSIPLFVKFGNQKLVLGTLSAENCPQLSFDLVFEKEFELSHNWKNGSVYFAGYKSELPEDEDGEYPDFTDSEDDLPVPATENGKPEPQAAKAKEDAAKPKVRVVEPASDVNDEDSDSDSEDFDDSDDAESDEDMGDAESDDEDDSEEDEETPTPKKAVGNKKRQAESEAKTPVSAKKAKAGTSQKSDVKTGRAVTPAKQASKTPNTDKSKTPKSGPEISCKSCSKTFKSEHAMEAHSKAKHSGGK